MRGEFAQKKRTRMPYKRSLSRRHTFCIKLENRQIEGESIFSHRPVTRFFVTRSFQGYVLSVTGLWSSPGYGRHRVMVTGL
jgi:hypothetical protein